MRVLVCLKQSARSASLTGRHERKTSQTLNTVFNRSTVCHHLAARVLNDQRSQLLFGGKFGNLQ
jgi:hypothetical protein